jgi:hypothetical protein
MVRKIVLLLLLTAFAAVGETNQAASTNVAVSPATGPVQSQAEAVRLAQRTEQIRADCIEGRRYIAGRVLQILPEGLVVDSGYSRLMSPPLNRSWVVRGTASVSRDASAVEERKPDAICIGPIFLSNIPKRPPVKQYDYVVIHAYPAGDYVYSPVEGIQKTVRRFSAGLDSAVKINLARDAGTRH